MADPMTDERLAALRRVADSGPRLGAAGESVGSAMAVHLAELLTEVDRLRNQLDIALGALADIAHMSDAEAASGVVRRKANRTYDAIRTRGKP